MEERANGLRETSGHHAGIKSTHQRDLLWEAHGTKLKGRHLGKGRHFGGSDLDHGKKKLNMPKGLRGGWNR